MDSSRFDALTTATRTLPRRRALIALLGAVAAGVAIHTGTDARCIPLNGTCSKKRKCCPGSACRQKRCSAPTSVCDGRTSPCIIPWSYDTQNFALTVVEGSQVEWNGSAQAHPVIWTNEGITIEFTVVENTQRAAMSQQGTFPFRCRPHQNMTGTITVVAAT